jgi:hypothetical protein
MIRWAHASWVANNVLQKIHGTFGDSWFAPILSATSVRVFDVPIEEVLDPRHPIMPHERCAMKPRSAGECGR